MSGYAGFRVKLRDGHHVGDSSTFVQPQMMVQTIRWDRGVPGRLRVTATDGSQWLADDVSQVGEVSVKLRRAEGDSTDGQAQYEHATESVRVAKMRLANAKTDGDDEKKAMYERDVATYEQQRLLAITTWIDDESGRLPAAAVTTAGRDVSALHARLEVHGGGLIFSGWTSQGTSPMRVDAHFPAEDPQGTLACLDALADWRER